MLTVIRDEHWEAVIARYPACVLDYVLIGSDRSESIDIEDHRAAVLCAHDRMIRRAPAMPDAIDPSRMHAEAQTPSELFARPALPYKTSRKDVTLLDPPERLTYWYAFLEPPHGTGYDITDWEAVNDALFPHGKDHLQIYRWNDEWSSYFDAGKEWWGTAMWSIYDDRAKRFVVIGASTTD